MKSKISVLLILSMLLSVFTVNGLATTYTNPIGAEQHATEADARAIITSARDDGFFVSDDAVVGYIVEEDTTNNKNVIPYIIDGTAAEGTKETIIVDYGMNLKTGEILRLTSDDTAYPMTTVPFITIYYTIDYEKTRNPEGYTFARLGGVSIYYNYKSGYSAANAPVSNLWATAELRGELVPYPDCMDWSFKELNSNVLDDNYCAIKTAGSSTLTSPNTFYSSGVSYPTTRAVWISNIFAGLAFLAEFSVNGKTYEDSISIFEG